MPSLVGSEMCIRDSSSTYTYHIIRTRSEYQARSLAPALLGLWSHNSLRRKPQHIFEPVHNARNINGALLCNETECSGAVWSLTQVLGQATPSLCHRTSRIQRAAAHVGRASCRPYCACESNLLCSKTSRSADSSVVIDVYPPLLLPFLIHSYPLARARWKRQRGRSRPCLLYTSDAADE